MVRRHTQLIKKHFSTAPLMLLVALPLLVVPSKAHAQITQITVDPIKYGDGSGVTFTPRDPIKIPLDPSILQNATLIETDPKPSKYQVYADQTTITSTLASFSSTYEFYIRPKNATDDGTILRASFQAQPRMSFLDQRTAVTLRIKDKAGENTATFQLPIHGFEKADVIGCEFGKRNNINISGDSLSVTLENKLPNLSLKISAPTLEGHDQSQWKKIELTNPRLPADGTFTIPSKDHLTLTWALTPDSGRILSRTLFPMKGQPDDNLTLTLSYQTEMGGFKLPFESTGDGVYFYPGAMRLGLAVAVGTFVGVIIMFFGLQKGNSNSFWEFIKTVLMTIAISLAIETLAAFLVINDSDFKILGVTVDPRQVLVAVVLGLVIGLGGFKTAQKILDAIGLK